MNQRGRKGISVNLPIIPDLGGVYPSSDGVEGGDTHPGRVTSLSEAFWRLVCGRKPEPSPP